MRVLVVNAGSSTLKLRVLDGDELETSRDLAVDRDGSSPDELASFLRSLQVDAVGHRVVHGGSTFTAPVRLDDAVVHALRGLTDLAPLHQPKSLAAIDAVSSALPDTPAVACFDTAFHATLPAAASTYALPEDWRTRWDIRRYGFHGLSHSYASRRAAELLDTPPADLRIVVCHLGAGASLCAIAGGRSVDTTMGFTPLEGLVMATRSGSVDPGLVLWLQEHAGLTAADIADALEHRSGLQALGGSADMRELLSAAAAGDPRARLAIDVYLHHLVAGIASMTAALGGLEALVFTGGVGEHASVIRQNAADALGFLGIGVDPTQNLERPEDHDISKALAPVRSLVIHAREDLEVVRGVRAVLTPSQVDS